MGEDFIDTGMIRGCEGGCCSRKQKDESGKQKTGHWSLVTDVVICVDPFSSVPICVEELPTFFCVRLRRMAAWRAKKELTQRRKSAKLGGEFIQNTDGTDDHR